MQARRASVRTRHRIGDLLGWYGRGIARALHIEFDGTRSIHDEDGTVTTFLPPGMTMRDALHKLGATAREVEVPDKPRRLSDDAARFIASYEREESDSVLAVFRRFGSLDAEEFDSVEQAERYLDGSEDEFLLAGEAVVTVDGTISFWP
jgi:hypothetical protein